MELAKRAQHLATLKNLQQEFDHFQTRSNILQHVTTECRPNVCSTRRATVLQDVALECCVRLTGP